MSDQPYEPPHGLLEMTPEQASVFSETTRTEIMVLLTERPASIKELAIALGKPRGTIGHHVHVLDEAGLIAVVRTRQVRAITEKFYGRLARTFVFPHLGPAQAIDEVPFLGEALAEMRPGREGESGYLTLRHARIPEDRVEEFAVRLTDLAEEFAASARGGTTVYGLIISIYATDRRSLPSGEEDEA